MSKRLRVQREFCNGQRIPSQDAFGKVASGQDIRILEFGLSVQKSWLFHLNYTLGDIGGALGLFLGASLLTIIDLIYICFRLGIWRRRISSNGCLTWLVSFFYFMCKIKS